jgi:hypothetical protein
VTPREFCRQSLEALALPGPPADARWRAALELLLGYFATDDLAPDTFERQLLLLADSDVCSCFSGAAWRVLDLWHLQATGRPMAGAARQN